MRNSPAQRKAASENARKRLINLEGMRINSVVVLSRVSNRGHRIYWLCRCDCGVEFEAHGHTLRTGETKRCKECNRKHLSKIRTKHGDSLGGQSKHGKRLYVIWCSMRWRCHHKASINYERWGGSGITVCDEWMEYKNFKKWAISNGYKNNLTIDRIDNNCGYTPENCRWATWKDQANNKRTNVIISYKNETMTLTQWARTSGIPKDTLTYRIKSGWCLEKALCEPLKKQKNSRTKEEILIVNG